MRREAKDLLKKACDGFVLAIELFNRPSDTSRVTGVLILLDHSLEMMLKAGIVHRGGRLRTSDAEHTFPFKKCVNIALDSQGIAFLTPDQALTLRAVNGLRDQAQHYLIDVREEILYVLVQSAVIVLRDVMASCFDVSLDKRLPARVMPVSTVIPQDPSVVLRDELEQIRAWSRPGVRRKNLVEAKLRTLVILDALAQGDDPDARVRQAALSATTKRFAGEDDLASLFPGAFSTTWSPDAPGAPFILKWSTREGIPVRAVNDDEAPEAITAFREVNHLDRFNLGARDLAEKLDTSTIKVVAAVCVGNVKDDPECFEEIVIGKSRHKRYSQKAIRVLGELIEKRGMDVIWTEYRSVLVARHD